MQRRHFLKCLAGFAGVAVLPNSAFAVAPSERIVIVGGGILGASLAHHLSRRGAHVTLLEKEAPSAGATGRSFAWINAEFSKRPFHYFDLNRLGVLSYRRLEEDLPGLPVQWVAACSGTSTVLTPSS